MAKVNKEVENIDLTQEEIKPISPEWKFDNQGKTNVRNITNINMTIILENTYGSRGEIQIPAGQSRPISNEEIMIKIESQNPSFVGTDGFGSNASLFIENVDFRKFLGFETDEKKQIILTDSLLAEILKTDKLSDFKEIIEDNVITFAEKSKLSAYLRKECQAGRFDSASKIDFVERYTKMKIKS